MLVRRPRVLPDSAGLFGHNAPVARPGSGGACFGFGGFRAGRASLHLQARSKGASRMPKVREVMTPDPATASPSMSVVEAAQEMIRKEKGPLPVVEGAVSWPLSPTATS